MLKIKELREEKELSQEEVARGINTSQRNIGRWEKEENEPTASFLIKLADYFEVSVDYLIGRTDELGIIQKENSLTKNESELLYLFKKLDTIKQNKVIGYCYALAN